MADSFSKQTQLNRFRAFEFFGSLTATLLHQARLNPAAAFDASLPGDAIPMLGNPDLIAQMLDKLIANAADFATPGSAIDVSLFTIGRTAVLSLANEGPLLPAGMQERLFDSMVSLRATGGGSPHLGLGLYIVRLIAQFHYGVARIDNLGDGSGIVVRIELPVAG